MSKAKSSRIAKPNRFEPELDGRGRVFSPLKERHLPKPSAFESPIALALREELRRGGSAPSASQAGPGKP